MSVYGMASEGVVGVVRVRGRVEGKVAAVAKLLQLVLQCETEQELAMKSNRCSVLARVPVRTLLATCGFTVKCLHTQMLGI